MKLKNALVATLMAASVFTLAPMDMSAVAATTQNVKAEKPNVYILATGGTIAGSAASNTQMTGYKAGALGVQTLLNAVPEIQKVANCTGEQIASIGSESMTVEIWLKLANRINELLARKDVDGIVITHGTDTLEETAYFLNLVVKSDKPVVIVGAMRPATAISADGPVNILNAVTLAADESARNRGVMIAMNDNINGARDVQKSNTLRVDTFVSPELGYLGYFEGGKPAFYKNTTRKHTLQTEFDIKGLKTLPRVDIVYSHVEDDGKMVEAAVKTVPRALFMPAPVTAPSMPIRNPRCTPLPKRASWLSAAPECPTARRSNRSRPGIRQALSTPEPLIRRRPVFCCSSR